MILPPIGALPPALAAPVGRAASGAASRGPCWPAVPGTAAATCLTPATIGRFHAALRGC